MSIDTGTPDQQQPTLEHLDPRTLILGPNVRQAEPDEDLVNSVRELGVVQAITVYKDEQGQFVVHCGGNRTLAAIEAKRETIPAMVIPRPDEVDRIVKQMNENTHRRGLSDAEFLNGVRQLAALGVPAARIAKRGGYKRPQVDAALKVVGSDLASKATERYEFLTLDQAAVLAEFEGDREAVKELVLAAREGRGFEHKAQRLRDERALAQEKEKAAEVIKAAGIRVVDKPRWEDKTTRDLSDLLHDGAELTADNHAECPGHAAYLAERWVWQDVPAEPDHAEQSDSPRELRIEDLHDPDDDYYDEDDEDDEDEESSEPARPRQEQVRKVVAVYVCTEWEKQGHVYRYGTHTDAGTSRKLAADMTEEEREAARAQRRDVIQSNKAWDSAEKVRRNWLRTFMARPSAPKTAAAFIAGSLARADHAVTQALTYGNRFAADLFGLGERGIPTYGRRSTALTDMIDKAKESRALMITLGLILAAYEDSLNRQSWRRVDEATARYLHFLEEHGYELSHVEKRASGDATGPEPEATTPMDLPGGEDTAPSTNQD